MKIFFSVGEPSGDLHGANLISQLRRLDPKIQCVGFGGPKMRSAGCELHHDLTQLAVMFFVEVITKLPHFFKLRKQARDYFKNDPPDAVILIDFPGFNWHIAKAARRCGIPVFYYGVPQMWAWAPWRIKKLKRNVDHVLCKLPFEPAWFREQGCKAHYVGHPYFDELHDRRLDSDFLQQLGRDSSAPVLTLLPGSRDHEVERNSPTLLKAAAIVQRDIPGLQVFIASFQSDQADYVRERLDEYGLEAKVHVGKTAELIAASTFCIACSGSVSLELMFHEKPTVIVYRVSRFKKMLARILLRAKFITLVNLMAAERIIRTGKLYDPDAADAEWVPFPEYVATRDCSIAIARWISHWYRQPEDRQSRIQVLKELNSKHAKPGATQRTAAMVLKCLADTKRKPEPADRANAA